MGDLMKKQKVQIQYRSKESCRLGQGQVQGHMKVPELISVVWANHPHGLAGGRWTPHRNLQLFWRNEQSLKLQVLKYIKPRLRMRDYVRESFWLWGAQLRVQRCCLTAPGAARKSRFKELLHGAMQAGLSRGGIGQL